MLRLAVDEDFDQRIALGLKRLRPDLDIVRAREVGLSGVDDPEVLRWAASEERVLVTHDVNTITKYAYQRVAAGQRSRVFSQSASHCRLEGPSRTSSFSPNAPWKVSLRAESSISP